MTHITEKEKTINNKGGPKLELIYHTTISFSHNLEILQDLAGGPPILKSKGFHSLINLFRQSKMQSIVLRLKNVFSKYSKMSLQVQTKMTKILFSSIPRFLIVLRAIWIFFKLWSKLNWMKLNSKLCVRNAKPI